VFSKPQIKELFSRYVLAELYIDKLPAGRTGASPEENQRLLTEEFKTAQLPYYVILRPRPGGGYDTVAAYDEGKINDVAAFVRFLEAPLGAGGLARAEGR
jgi:hypothetical protein